MTAAQRIFLIGLMASGKTSVGRELARRTGWRYLDNDELVLELTGRTGAELRVESEDVLHAAEEAAFERALGLEPPVIIGVAGWVPVDANARARMRDAGTVAWLRAAPETLFERALQGGVRRHEALSLDWVEQIASERAAALHAAATVTVDVDDLSVADAAQQILDAVAN
jgi:shikimate kinase